MRPLTDQHYNTGPGYPQSKAEVEALYDEALQAFMGECSVEPADPNTCLACYAYLHWNDRQVAACNESEVDWKVKYHAAHEEIMDRQVKVQALLDQNRWLFAAGERMAYQLNRWMTLHRYGVAGSLKGDSKVALEQWEGAKHGAQELRVEMSAAPLWEPPQEAVQVGPGSEVPHDPSAQPVTDGDTIAEVAAACYQTSRNHGWWEGETFNIGEKLMLICSEAAEALEHWRRGQDITEVFYGPGDKPDGFPIELADIVIRVFDLAEHYGLDIERAIKIKMAFNETRPYKHGGKLA
jgi:NTP pyrophosphatase (non-canonical NTP hydrolase)